MYHTKKIGVFISHTFGKYQSNLCQGMLDKATEYGYQLEIFSSFDGENLGNYSIGEDSILNIPNYDDFSGVIFASGTYLLSDLRNKIGAILKEKCTCPIIEVNQIPTDFPTVALDNDNSAAQITEHLISVHRYKRVCYLGNSIQLDSSISRYNEYKNVLLSHNISIMDSDSFTCDTDESSMEQALDHFLLSSSEKLDAIVCYNDQMALFMMIAILRRGLRIPEDIAVTGCDNLDFGHHMKPTLTTVTFPVYELGVAAIEQLLKLLDDIIVEQVRVVQTVPKIGSSCGCEKNSETPSIFYIYELLNKIEALENATYNSMNMSTNLLGITDIDEGMNRLEKYVSEIDNCSELYICLYNDWDSASKRIQEIILSDDDIDTVDHNTIQLKFAYKNGKRLHECTFTKQSMLPNYIYDNSNSTYLYYPLYFEEKEFGYIALSYYDNKLTHRINFLSWITYVSSMLKYISDTKHMNLVVSRLEDIYMRDEMTGLYNQNSFPKLSSEVIAHALEYNESILVAVFNLNDLKGINDTYGHKEGNFAIQVLGHALENSIKEKDICARISGDIFYLIGSGYNGNGAMTLTSKVNRYLENYNKLHTKNYQISVSNGYVIELPQNIFDLQELIDVANNNLYLEKKKK